jgi:uncharacterized membrane protein
MQSFIKTKSYITPNRFFKRVNDSKPKSKNFISKKIFSYTLKLNNLDSESIYPQKGNFSRNKQKKTGCYYYICLIFSTLGCFETFYLTISKLNDSLFLCSDQNCSIVLNSSFSYLFNIPLSFFGFLLYFFVGTKLFNLIQSFKYKNVKKYSIKITTLSLSLVLGVFSTYFIYILEQVIKSSCPWCFFSIFLSGSLLIISTINSSGNENFNFISSISFLFLLCLLIVSIHSLNIIEIQGLFG